MPPGGRAGEASRRIVGCRNARWGRRLRDQQRVPALRRGQRHPGEPAGEGRATRECRVVLSEPVGGALDLRVTRDGRGLDGERFTICVLKDISDQKRLAVLARMFFHDVMNTAGSIQGSRNCCWRSAAAKLAGEARTSAAGRTGRAVGRRDPDAQRDLTYAESGDLEPECGRSTCARSLERLQAVYARHPVARRPQIELPKTWDGEIVTDERLLAPRAGQHAEERPGGDRARRPGDVRCVEQARAWCSASTTTP